MASKLFKILIVTSVCFLLTTKVLADFQVGMDAYNQGDYATALKEWQPLAEKGLAQAQHNLGLLYLEGQGIPKDYQEALRWNALAAEQGLAEAQHLMGVIYIEGYGVPNDDGKAARWLRLAAEQGNFSGQFLLGGLYFQGRGVPTNYILAHMWLNLAAAQDNEMHELARILRTSLEKVLAPEQIAEAQRLADEWLVQHQK